MVVPSQRTSEDTGHRAFPGRPGDSEVRQALAWLAALAVLVAVELAKGQYKFDATLQAMLRASTTKDR